MRFARFIAAALVLLAVGVQLADQIRDRASVVNFFSFFTILSNLFAAVVLILVASHGPGPRPRWLDLLRGAAVLYLAITFIVFALLLSDQSEDLQLTFQWVDAVLHRVVPVLVMFDWLVDPPHTRIRWREALAWLAFPIAWVTYALVRGAVVDWYPYPFLDPRLHGWGGVAGYCVAIAVGATVLALLVAWVGNRLRSGRTSARARPAGTTG